MNLNFSDYALNNNIWHYTFSLYTDVFITLTPSKSSTVIESEGFVEFKLEVVTPDVNTPLPLEIFIDMITVSGTAGKWIILLTKILSVCGLF